MLTMQDRNVLYCLRFTLAHISRWTAECQFPKKLFFQLHVAIWILIRVCLFAAWLWTVCRLSWEHGPRPCWAVGRVKGVCEWFYEWGSSAHIPCLYRVRIERKWWDSASLCQPWACSSISLLPKHSQALSNEVPSDLKFSLSGTVQVIHEAQNRWWHVLSTENLKPRAIKRFAQLEHKLF